VLAERLEGPTVMAGHSYGGAVISGAATGVENVIGLVFASAFAPDEGETLGGRNALFPPPPGLAHAQPDSLGFLWFDPAAIPANFAPDIPVPEARVLAATQKPIAARCFVRGGGAAGVEDPAVVVPGPRHGAGDQPRPGALDGRPHPCDHGGDSLQPRLAGFPPSAGRRADPGSRRGGRTGRVGRATRWKGVPYGFDLDVDDENVENN
jgi:hypothetical protein